MRSAYLYGIEDARIIDVDRPVARPGEILMNIRAATTCGTDFKIFVRGYHGWDGKTPIPWGHECAGDVAELGEGVKGWEVGDRIVSHNTAACGRCWMCLRRLPQLCEDWVSYRSNPTNHGAYSEYIAITARQLELVARKIPDDIEYWQAAQVEPMSCAIHGVEGINVQAGDSLAIIGSGPQGLYQVQYAKKLKGATTVISIDLVDYRLKMAKKLGADHTINATGMKTDEIVEKVKSYTDGRGADKVIEAVGTPQTWETAVKLARKGGVINEYAGCKPGTTVTYDTADIHYKNLTIKGIFHTTPYLVQKTYDYILSGVIDTKSMVTGEFKLEEVQKAYDILKTTKEAIKMAIIP